MPYDEPRGGGAKKERGSRNRIRFVQYDAIGAVPPQLEREGWTEWHRGGLTQGGNPHDVDLAASLPHGRVRIVGGHDLDVPVRCRAVAEVAQHGFHPPARGRIELRGVHDGGSHINSQLSTFNFQL